MRKAKKLRHCEWPFGEIFLRRCGGECDGRHVHVQIGQEGEIPLGDHVTDAAGAREIAAHLCELAEEIEAAGLQPKVH
jgi:hypothetical protein